MKYYDRTSNKNESIMRNDLQLLNSNSEKFEQKRRFFTIDHSCSNAIQNCKNESTSVSVFVKTV